MRRAEPIALAASLLLAGCGALGPGLPDKPMFRDARLPVAAAANAIVPGRTTRAELVATLGEAETLRFDGGHEVWAWRARPARGTQPELVVLLGPDGIVRKVRVRPGDAH
jgi:hypothetical protein